MPIDYYVNAAAGRDTNNGSAGSPVRSIHRAAQIAADNVSRPGNDSGRILVSAGTFAPPQEQFPILIPPDFDLIGAGRGLTTIQFTGEVRTAAGDPAILYWGGTAIMAGRRVQALTLEAAPRPAGYSCSGMTGIHCINNDTVVEDVHVILPEPFDRNRGLNQSVRMDGITGSVLSTRIERQPNRRGLALFENATTVDRLELRQAHCEAVDQHGSRISGSIFEEESTARLTGDVQFDHNTFRGKEIHAGSSSTVALGARVGPRNDLACTIGVWLSGDAILEDNQILGGHRTLQCGWGSPTVRRNRIAYLSRSAECLLIVYFGSTPRIEENYFSAFTPSGRQGPFWGTLPALRIYSEADFGRGPQNSVGRNHFKCVYNWFLNETDIPDGGTVFMSDNYWHDSDPRALQAWMGVASGTRVIIGNPQRDPELCRRPDLQQRWRPQRRGVDQPRPLGPADQD